MSIQQKQSPLTLADLERVIEDGLQTFVDVGLALMEVRDRKLYEDAGYTTFELYCYGRWGFSDRRGRQLIDAASTAKTLADASETGTMVPVSRLNERQARELAPLARTDPDAARATWREVVEESEETGEPVTAARVRESVQRRTQPVQREPMDDGWQKPTATDPRIAQCELALKYIEWCVGQSRDVYTDALRAYASQLRAMVREMRNDPRLNPNM